MKLYLEPNQAGSGVSSGYETALGDAIEAAFGEGRWELPDLVAFLNERLIRAPDGALWTEESFERVMKELGASHA